MLRIPEEFNTLEGEDRFTDHLSGFNHYFKNAMLQMSGILEHMGAFSLVRLLEAIDNGRVEGRYYSNFPWKEMDLSGVKFEDFNGCLLGWAGYLECQSLTKFNDQICDLFTGSAEAFVSRIHEGDTPATNPFARRFREMVELELKERELEFEIPVRQQEEVETNA